MKSGRGMKITNITPMTAMYKIINIIDDWGKTPRRYHYGKGIDICDSNKKPFDWEMRI